MKLHKNHELSTFSLHVFLLCTSVILNFESTDGRQKKKYMIYSFPTAYSLSLSIDTLKCLFKLLFIETFTKDFMSITLYISSRLCSSEIVSLLLLTHIINPLVSFYAPWKHKNTIV